MKALTIWQPHASLLASGLRIVETRGWSTSYRGPLMIHAGKAWNDYIASECGECNGVMEEIAPRNVMSEQQWKRSLGCVLAVAELYRCDPIPEPCGTAFDINLGGFGPGRFGLFLRNVRPLRRPVKATGKQGLWAPSLDLLNDVEEAL